MQRYFTMGLAYAAWGLCGCAPAPPVAGVPAATLAQNWMFGIERMRDDPLLLAPYSNRLLADLSAMPHVRIVSLDNPTNGFLFQTLTAPKIRVMSWLRGERSCMQFTYTVLVIGQEAATFGQVVPALPVGPEPDSACVDRAATAFYHALVEQGL